MECGRAPTFSGKECDCRNHCVTSKRKRNGYHGAWAWPLPLQVKSSHSLPAPCLGPAPSDKREQRLRASPAREFPHTLYVALRHFPHRLPPPKRCPESQVDFPAPALRIVLARLARPQATASNELICARTGPFAAPRRSSVVRAASRTCCSCRSRRWRRPCRRRSG